MIRYFLIALVTVAALIGAVTAPVAAQAADDLPEPDQTTTDDPAHQRIDANTQLVEARLEDGTAVLVLESSETQRITVTDAGAMMAGGEIPRKHYLLKAGEKTTVRMDVHVDGVFAGVTIDTGDTLWGIPLESGLDFLPGGATTQDVQVAGITGLLTTGLLALGIALKRRRGLGADVERIV